jgi:transposase
MLERIRFVELAAQEEHGVPGLCELFGVSRAEGYRVLKRFREEGYEGLVERSRRPRSNPHPPYTRRSPTPRHDPHPHPRPQ